ncbi:MAG: ComF family protein [Clostridia bacterium]|nr:ComF family protein [Clostridiales bacterium]MBQ6716539.1 ComF family protein [Clostridia bacterium]
MKSSMFLTKVRKSALDFLIAPKANCIGCTSPLGANNSFLCSNCFASLSPLYTTHEGARKICRLCGSEIDGLRCRCGGRAENAYNTYSAYYFELPVSTLIKSFKYKSITSLADWLSDEMISALKNERDFDVITFVPMHPLRKIKRGFNQSEILAKCISEKLQIPCASIIKRSRFTRKQATLSGDKRRKNLVNAFKMKDTDVKDKRILIVDDVRTTGTTIISCANLLKENGAGRISALTLACAKRKKS